MTQILMTRDQLLTRLAEQRKVAEQFDKQALAEHRAEEKAYLTDFRANCREALKWDYETAKEKDFEVRPARDGRRRWGQPQCPTSQVIRIDRAIAHVTLDSRAKYALNNSGIHSTLHALVTWDPDAPSGEDLC